MDTTDLAIRMLKSVRNFVQPALDQLVSELGSLECRMTAKINAQQEEIKALREALQISSASALTAEQVRDEVAAATDKAIADLLAPAAPNAVTADELMPMLLAELRKMVAEIPAPKNGASVTVDDVMPALLDAVKAQIAELPKPENGKDGRDGRDGIDGKSVAPEDIEKMLDARMSSWALDFERRAQAVLERAVDRMPKPRDGMDGLGFDDLSIEHDGERRVTLKFQRGERVKEFELRLPLVIDRGIYKPETRYEKSDGVTFGGSFWIAQKDEPGKPGDGDGWRLSVKRGRDGKDGEKGEKGDPGRVAKDATP